MISEHRPMRRFWAVIAAMGLLCVSIQASALEPKILELLRALQANGELEAYLTELDQSPSAWSDECNELGGCRLPKLDNWLKTISPEFSVQVPRFHIAEYDSLVSDPAAAQQAELNKARRANFDFAMTIVGDGDNDDDGIPDLWQRPPKCPSNNVPAHLRGNPGQPIAFPARPLERTNRGVLVATGPEDPDTNVYRSEYTDVDHSDGQSVLDYWQAWHRYAEQIAACPS